MPALHSSDWLTLLWRGQLLPAAPYTLSPYRSRSSSRKSIYAWLLQSFSLVTTGDTLSLLACVLSFFLSFFLFFFFLHGVNYSKGSMLSFDNVMFMTNCYVRSRLFESFTFASICYMFASMAKTNYTHSPHRNKLSSEQNQKTYNSRDSLVVTHPTTNRPACGLCMDSS